MSEPALKHSRSIGDDSAHGGTMSPSVVGLNKGSSSSAAAAALQQGRCCGCCCGGGGAAALEGGAPPASAHLLRVSLVAPPHEVYRACVRHGGRGAGGERAARARWEAKGGGAGSSTRASASAPRILTIGPPHPLARAARSPHTGARCARMGWLQLLVLTILGGAFVGVGFSICLAVGGNLGLCALFCLQTAARRCGARHQQCCGGEGC